MFVPCFEALTTGMGRKEHLCDAHHERGGCDARPREIDGDGRPRTTRKGSESANEVQEAPNHCRGHGGWVTRHIGYVVLIAGSTGSALRADRPPNLHIAPKVDAIR